MVNRSLQDTAAMAVGRNLDEIGGNSIVDELIIFWYKLIQTFLDDLGERQLTLHKTRSIRPTHMISVEIFDEGNNVHAQCVNQGSNLLRLPGLR